jgi:zinc/manganese transport system substrate-binding protein
MKRIFVVVAAVLGGILPAEAKLNVVATLPDLAAMARDIGGDAVDVVCIGKAGEDPHFVQAKPSYIVKLNRADVLIENGLELEIGWLPALVEQTRNYRIRLGAPGRVVAAEGVPLLEVPTGPVTRAMGDVHPGGNPHFSLDPERGKIVAKSICEGLVRVAPQWAEEFRANLARLAARLDAALATAQTLMAPYRGAKVVTYHKSLTYLAERFGLNVINTVEPKPGIPPSPSHIAALIAQMKSEGVKVILMEPWHERRTPELIAQKTGATLVVLDTQSATDYPATCVKMAGEIAEALK